MNNYLDEMKEIYRRSLQQGSTPKFSRVICPRTYDTRETKNTCRLCDLVRDTIFDRSKPKDDPIKAVAKRYSAKKKYYSNIIFVAKPDEVHLLEYGDKIFNKLIALQADELSEYKNFMHPAQGRNIYISKIKVGPDVKDVDYDVQPRVAVTALQNAQVVLKNIHDLDNIVPHLINGTVTPLPQSKFEFQKTEIRVLPNGNPHRPLFFFKMVWWHEGITQEEFAAVQAGKFNPITGLYTVSEPPLIPMPGPTAKNTVNVEDDILAKFAISDSDVMKDMFAQDVEQAESNGADSGIEAEGGDDELIVDSTTEPICFGQYDKTNNVCNTKCVQSGWGEPCQKVHAEKLALRARAKRLTSVK